MLVTVSVKYLPIQSLLLIGFHMGLIRLFIKIRLIYVSFLLSAILSEVANKQGKDEEQNEDRGGQPSFK